MYGVGIRTSAGFSVSTGFRVSAGFGVVAVTFVLAACGQSSNRTYDIGPIFPLTANKCRVCSGCRIRVLRPGRVRSARPRFD